MKTNESFLIPNLILGTVSLVGLYWSAYILSFVIAALVCR
jgi:hypothetical protein